MVKLRQEAADKEEEDQVNPTEKEILRETVQPALMSKKTNTQNNKNWKKATVTENEDSTHKFTLKGQGKKQLTMKLQNMIHWQQKEHTIKFLKQKRKTPYKQNQQRKESFP